MIRLNVLACFLLAACNKTSVPSHAEPPRGGLSPEAPDAPRWRTLDEQVNASTVPSAVPGEDDGSTVSMVHELVHQDFGEWERIAAPAGAHPMICDIAWFNDAVWASFGNKTISTDGARVYSWKRERGWKLEFNWDRGGTAGVTHEQGGQGITRLRVIDQKLYATDADAPNFGGFGITAAPLEGYVFVAGAEGFAELEPGQLPPSKTLLVENAFHVFDVTRFMGRLIAAGGTLSPPKSKSRFPGGLFLADASGTLRPRFFPGRNAGAGVIRATFLHRFRGRLYVGFQNNERRMEWDLCLLSEDPALAETELVLGRVTEEGGWKTRHFASDSEHLYWIASDHRDRSAVMTATPYGLFAGSTNGKGLFLAKPSTP